MNPRPILIATCCALALVAFVYFFGKQHFSPSVDDTADRAMRRPTHKPVNELPTPTESSEIHDENIIPAHKEVAPQRSTENTTDEVKRYKSGPYKGLTYQQAMAVYEWDVKKNKLLDSRSANVRRKIALSDAILANTDEEISLIFNIVKLLPDDILQQVKAKVEKQHPELQEFFDDLSNHPGSMTPTEIEEADIKMRSAREILWTTSDELNREYEQIQAKLETHYGNYPQF